jgi:hypothetical protein
LKKYKEVIQEFDVNHLAHPGEETNSLHQHLPHVLGPAVQSTGPYSNKSQIQPTQMIPDDINGPVVMHSFLEPP